jgi:hypothetical protein
MRPNAGVGWGCGVTANEYSCAHGAQINFGDLTSFNPWEKSEKISNRNRYAWGTEVKPVTAVMLATEVNARAVTPATAVMSESQQQQ